MVLKAKRLTRSYVLLQVPRGRNRRKKAAVGIEQSSGDRGTRDKKPSDRCRSVRAGVLSPHLIHGNLSFFLYSDSNTKPFTNRSSILSVGNTATGGRDTKADLGTTGKGLPV